MGVKGLSSLLADDPRRFGMPWSLGMGANTDTCNCEEQQKTTIYIDGPALLHHLLAAYSSSVKNGKNGSGATSCTSIPPIDYLPPSLFGQVSPEAVYVLAEAFASSLLSSDDAKEIHLVLDGLASIHKTEAQLGRLSEACRRADLAAKRLCSAREDYAAGSIGAWDVPHLFAERAMKEAFLDVIQQSTTNSNTGRCYVHHAHGEAEGFIAHLIERQRDVGGEAIVLSNDSDFLVYNVPAFVPLHSLRFESSPWSLSDDDDTNSQMLCCTITGWRYYRTKFLAAFSRLIPRSSGVEDGAFATMSAVSALSGNDYTLPSQYKLALNSARSVIVQSDIGGLRRKERNGPTAKATVTAVIRFVGHFACRGKTAKQSRVSNNGIRSDRSGWLWQLVIAATKEGKKKDERESILFEALLLVRQIYSDDARVKESLSSSCSNNVDVARRLVERSTFFCQPLVETFGSEGIRSNRAKKRRVVNTKRNQKAGKKKRPSLVQPDGKQLISGSKWMLPHLVNFREKLYNVMANCVLSKSGEECRTLTKVEEYCRVGGGEMTQFKDVSIYTPVDQTFPADDSSDKVRALLGYCFCLSEVSLPDGPALASMLERYLVQVPSSLWCPFLSALLLFSRQDVLLLFIIVAAPRIKRTQRPRPQVNAQVLDTAIGIQLALYHAIFALGAVDCCVTSNDAGSTNENLVVGRMQPSSCFQDELIVAIWHIIREEVVGGDESLLDLNIETMKGIFESIERSLNSSLPDNTMDEWLSSSLTLWEQYLLYLEELL